MTTYLDIIDTAIKIGLGAFIAGVSTYAATRLRYKKEGNLALEQRRREILESTVDKIQIFVNSALNVRSLLLEFVRCKESNTEIRAELEAELEKAKIELANKYSDLSQAESLLLLVGAESAQKMISKIGQYTQELMPKLWLGNRALTEGYLIDIRAQIVHMKLSIIREISKLYMETFVK